MIPAAHAGRPVPAGEAPRSDRLTIGPMVAIAAAGVALRLLHGPRLEGIDDAGYLEMAVQVAQQRVAPHLVSLFRFRVGLTYPFGWILRAGWLTPDQFWIVTLVVDAIALVCLMKASANVWGRRAGLIAGLLYSVYPLAVEQSATYLPTAFQVAGIALGLALLTTRTDDETTSAMLAVVAGGVMGLAYLAKEDVAISIFAVAVAALATGWRSPKVAFAFCAGAAVVFLAECSVYWWEEGHPLFRLAGTSGGASPETTTGLPIASIWEWHGYLRSLFVMPYKVGLFWWCALPAAAVGLSSKDKALQAMTWSLLVVLAYLQFGSGTIGYYTPLPKTPRYTAIATPFLLLVLTGWLAAAWQRGRARMAQLVLLAVVVASVPCLAFSSLAAAERTRNSFAAVRELRDRHIMPVYTDYYSARVLKILTGNESSAVALYHADWKANVVHMLLPIETLRGSYVLLDYQQSKIYTSESGYLMKLPEAVRQPPGDWQRVWSHQAYESDSLGRRTLEGLRNVATIAGSNAVTQRVVKNVADMIDHDDAVLYFVPVS